MPKVSIIVPVYNRESSIFFCLESIDAIEYRDFEVIVIDDGSTDKSSEICNEFCKTHLCFHYIRQENKGVSNARNHGISIATGEWITFVDSDDAVTPEHLNVIKIEEGNNVDWIIESFQLSEICNKETHLLPILSDAHKTKTETDKPVEYYFTDLLKSGTPMFSTCGKFFKHTICKQHKIKFNEGMSLDEDQLFISEYLRHIQKLVHYPLAKTYINIDRPISRLSGKLQKPDVYLYGITENYNAFRLLDKMASNHNIPYAINYLVNNVINRILLGYTRPKNRDKISNKELKQFIKQNLLPVFKKIYNEKKYLRSGFSRIIYNLILRKHYNITLFICKSYNIYRSVYYKLNN